MKRGLLLTLTLLLCLGLVGCNKTPDIPNTSQTDIPGNTGESTGVVQVQKPDSLPTTGWIIRCEADMEQFAFVETGLYYMVNQCLYYMDTATGISVSLCSKPGCKHAESSTSAAVRACDAYVPGLVTMMFYHDGNLYYTIFEEYGYELYARSQDGTDLRKVATLGSTYLNKDTSMQIKSWVFAYGHLYYVMCVDNVIMTGENSFANNTSMFVLGRMDVSSGKEEELLRSTEELIGLQGANEDMAVVYMSYLPTDADRERPDYKDYVNQFPSYLRLWHKESGGVSTLCEMDRSAASSLLGIANGKLHMFGGSGTEIYAYDLAAGTFGKSDLPEEANRIWSEKYAGVKWQGYYDLETGTYYTNEYDTMQLPAGIDGFGAAPVGFGQQGVVVKEYYSKDDRGVFNNYVFFPFEKLDDGIQLTDRIIFMRESGEGSQILQPETGS